MCCVSMRIVDQMHTENGEKTGGGGGVRGWGYLFYELREQDGRDRFKYLSYLFEKKSSV